MYVARYPSHEVQEAATRSAVWELGYQDVKPEQMKVVEAYVQGRDVFAVLPTGYGKSLGYSCLPIVFNKLTEGHEGNHSIVVVDNGNYGRSGKHSTTEAPCSIILKLCRKLSSHTYRTHQQAICSYKT